MVKYDLRVSLTDRVGRQFRDFVDQEKYRTRHDAFESISAVLGISESALDGIVNGSGLQKTISTDLYLFICPKGLAKKAICQLQEMNMPELFKSYARRYYPECSYEQARPKIAQDITNEGIKEKGIEGALDIARKRKQPVPLNVAIPIYLASRLKRIGNYRKIFELLGYTIEPVTKEHSRAEREIICAGDDDALVRRYMGNESLIDALRARASLAKSLGARVVKVTVRGYDGPTDIK